jgi:hypothetical protein
MRRQFFKNEVLSISHQLKCHPQPCTGSTSVLAFEINSLGAPKITPIG